MDKTGKKTVAQNRKARHDFFFEEVYEAGLVLTGTEIKSVRAGGVNLRDSFAKVDANSEVWVYNMHISPYEKGNRFNADPLRPKKLLLNRREIRKLLGYTSQQGLTLIPVEIYLVRGRAKMSLAVARGKKLYDKREDIKKRDQSRDAARDPLR